MAKIDFRGPCRAFTNRVREGIFSHENIVKNWLRRKICDWWLNLDALLDAMFLHDQSLRVTVKYTENGPEGSTVAVLQMKQIN